MSGVRGIKSHAAENPHRTFDFTVGASHLWIHPAEVGNANIPFLIHGICRHETHE